MIKNSVGILLVALGLFFACVSHDNINPKTQLKNDIAFIQSYIDLYDPSAIKTVEGVWYSFDTVGLGIYPVVSDSVNLEYSISSIIDSNGYKLKWLDSSIYSPKKTHYKLLSSVIAGLQIGLPRFPVGSWGKIYVPSGFAFGTSGRDTVGDHAKPPFYDKPIGVNANLLFTIKLVAAKGSHFSSDTAAVTKYLGTVAGTILADNGGKGKFVKDPSGIRYWYDTLYADSLHPNLTNHKTIELTYKAKVFNGTDYFENYGRFSYDLTQQVNAWKIILPKISKGSQVKIFVPSGYGYGSNTTRPPLPADVSISIPANSNLVYEMKLDSVY